MYDSKRYLISGVCLLIASSCATATPSPGSMPTRGAPGSALPVAEFDPMPRSFTASLDDWQRRDFSGMTHYSLVDDHGSTVLRGDAKDSATLLYREKAIDLHTHPVLDWSWKVTSVLPKRDERARDGDDFPARLYVVAQTGFLPWESLAINYVWASEVPVGTMWPNPFTDKAVMIAVQSGPMLAGRWTRQRRDVAADFQQAFGESVDRIDAYAVMVDSDNAGGSATGWFGAVEFQPWPEP